MAPATMKFLQKMAARDPRENPFNALSAWESQEKAGGHVLITEENRKSLHEVQQATEFLELDKIKAWSH
jgi:hypothetical protein